MTRVMIAVDGSDLDARLAEAAHDLFGSAAEYWAVNVQNGLVESVPGTLPMMPGMYGGAFVGYGVAHPFTPRPPDDLTAAPADRDGEARDVARATAASAGIDDAAVVAETGDPPTAILRAAHRHDADVIVIGSRDRGWWSRLLEPSVSSDVVEASPVPVVVVPETP